jgi:hypothetical protein
MSLHQTDVLPQIAQGGFLAKGESHFDRRAEREAALPVAKPWNNNLSKLRYGGVANNPQSCTSGVLRKSSSVPRWMTANYEKLDARSDLMQDSPVSINGPESEREKLRPSLQSHEAR